MERKLPSLTAPNTFADVLETAHLSQSQLHENPNKALRNSENEKPPEKQPETAVVARQKITLDLTLIRETETCGESCIPESGEDMYMYMSRKRYGQ